MYIYKHYANTAPTPTIAHKITHAQLIQRYECYIILDYVIITVTADGNNHLKPFLVRSLKIRLKCCLVD